MARHSPHAACSWVMHDTPQHGPVLVVFRGRDFRPPSCVGQEARVRHLQGSEDIFLGVAVQRHAGHSLD